MSERLGQLLLRYRKITEKELSSVLERQVIMGGRLGTNLIELGYITEKELTDFLGEKLQLPSVTSDALEKIPSEVINLIPSEMAERYQIIPFKKEKNTLHLVMLDPTDLETINEISFITSSMIRPYVAPEARIRYGLEKYYKIKRDLRYITLLEEERRRIEEKERRTVPKGPTEEELNYHLRAAKEAYVKGADRDEIVSILLERSLLILDRVAIFVIKGDKIYGWKWVGFPRGEEGIKKVEIPLERLPSFLKVAEGKEYYNGPMDGNKEFVKATDGEAPSEIILIPLILKEQTVAIFYGDNLPTKRPIENIPYLERLCSKASLALEMLILKRKILEM